MAKNKPVKTPISDPFHNRKQAHEWLKDHGHKVASATFYAACANGFPSVAADGSVPRADVIRYSKTLDKTSVLNSDFAEQKEKLQLRSLELDVAKKEREARKDDELWLYRNEAYAQMAAFLGTLIENVEHQFQINMDEIIESVDGNLALREQGYMVCEEIIGRGCNETLALGQINRVLVKGGV